MQVSTLDHASCSCLSWTELVRQISHNQAWDENSASGAITYEKFKTDYYPYLFDQQAVAPPPLLVWAEYFNRIQSFDQLVSQQFRKQHHTTTARYFSTDAAWESYSSRELCSLGVPLSTADKVDYSTGAAGVVTSGVCVRRLFTTVIQPTQT